ncbi:hypothetical protein GGF46_004454 [Coemansia sp. RSA 552]|nr:hypothetical protein GGF46_004454 [Coemansia sp. RSA 552]
MATTTTTLVGQLVATAVPILLQRDDNDDDGLGESMSQVEIDVDYLFDWVNVPGTGAYFSAANVDAAQQLVTATLMGTASIFVFSLLRQRWPELYSHRLRLRQMRPSNIPRTLFGWIYPMVTMSDRHVLETMGLDAVLYFRSYRMLIYMFICLSAFGMLVLYPVNYYWSKDDPNERDTNHTIFDSPIDNVKELSGRYSAAHAVLAYVFAAIIFFYIDRFALHTVAMRWHYLLLTRRSGNSRTLAITHLPRELRSEPALERFVRGMHAGEVEAVHVTPMSNALSEALAKRAKVLARLELALVGMLGNPCRAQSYDPELLKRLVLTDSDDARVLERQLLRRWARRTKLRRPVARPQKLVLRTDRWWFPLGRTDAIDHWRQELQKADTALERARKEFRRGEGGSTAFVTMRNPVDALALSQLNVHARPNACKISMAPEARSIVWRNVAKPHSSKVLRYMVGFIWTVALLLLWCVPVALISTLISLRFLITRFPHLADVIKDSQFVRSLLSYTLPSLILTIFMTILPRLLWSFVLLGGDRYFGRADMDMWLRHLYFLIIYVVVIFGMSGTVWSAAYDLFTNFGGFWRQLVDALPHMATWYCVYVMLYGIGYQIMKLLHLKSVCRFLFHQARAKTPRQYMKAISPVFIDWGTFQPYTVLFFFIGVLYSHLQPLLLAMCLLYFILGMGIMRYMTIYSWYFRQENAGLLWPSIIRRMVLCVMAYQALTTAIFGSNSENHWFVAPMLILMLFTWYYFWVRCPRLRQLSENLPLQLLREAERRRKLQLMREERERGTGLSTSSAIEAVPEVRVVDAVTSDNRQSVGEQADAEPLLEPEPPQNDLDNQALVPKHARIHRRYGALLRNAAVHPIRALVSTVSLWIRWLQGDPAEALWAHMDDYAFPERVDRLHTPAAGRAANDPYQPKEQPGSVVDILRSAVMGIPRACVSVGSEFFMDFYIPRAHLDTSVVDYPRLESTGGAFEHGFKRHPPIRKRANSDAEPQSDSNSLNPASHGQAESVRQMQFCLAPSYLPEAFTPCIDDTSSISAPGPPLPPIMTNMAKLLRARTTAPLEDALGKPMAMQYQASSSELPHGTQMNRRWTDFSQPNMSYLPGILDSTRFSYMHPGLYGDLPSLWVPVQPLRRRAELKKTAGQRLRNALHAVERAIEDNFIGEKTAGKLHEKRRMVSRRVKDAARLTSFASRQSLSHQSPRLSAMDDKLLRPSSISEREERPEAGPPPPPVDAEPPMEVQRKVDDMLVESRCSALGIDPQLLSCWDPHRLHRATTTFQDLRTSNDSTRDASAENDSLLEDSKDTADALSDCDSDFIEDEPSPGNPLRRAEEGQQGKKA